MSQPPSPYSRSYSFTAWKVSNPNDPLPGNNVDQQLDNVATSLNATISRLNEIQRDDGKIDISSIISATDQFNAASAVYATNLSLLPDKAEARANLELNQYYPELAGDNLFIEPQISTRITSRPFVVGVAQPSQNSGYSGYDVFQGPMPSSSYNSRKFRSSILFGTLQDSATSVHGDSGFADISYRVDNVSFALMYAGKPGIINDGNSRGYYNNLVSFYYSNIISTGELTPTVPSPQPPYSRQLLGKENYGLLGNLPSIGNPLVSLRQLGDAMSTHEQWFNHFNIPRNAQKQFLDDLINPNEPYSSQESAINNASGYTAGSFNTTYYPKEIKIKLKGVTYAVPARIVT